MHFRKSFWFFLIVGCFLVFKGFVNAETTPDTDPIKSEGPSGPKNPLTTPSGNWEIMTKKQNEDDQRPTDAPVPGPTATTRDNGLSTELTKATPTKFIPAEPTAPNTTENRTTTKSQQVVPSEKTN